MISCGPLPLISPWLYRISLKRAGCRAANGEMEAVRELADVICTDSDPKARDLARRGLSYLSSPDQIDLLCRIILTQFHPDLVALAIDRGYHPSVPAEQVLYHFCIPGSAEPETLNAEDRFRLLAEGYAGASVHVRAWVRSIARINGAESTLARSLAGTCTTRYAGDWSYDEWDIVINGLISKENWAELWILAPLAPVSLAVTAITALKEGGWVPGGDDQLLWNEIIAALPRCWAYPVPVGNTRDAVGRFASQVTRLCLSPDGTLIATGSCDGMITVYLTASSGRIREISTSTGSIRFLRITSDNSHIIHGGEDGMVHCHSLQDTLFRWSWAGDSHASAVSISSDNLSVLIGDERGFLHSISLHDGREYQSGSLHPSPVTCLAQAEDGSFITCGHADGTVSVRYPGVNRSLCKFPGNHNPVCSLAISKEGGEVLAIYEQSLPVLWDIVTGTKIRTFMSHSGHTVCTAMSLENRWFAIGSNDHMIRFWNQNESLPFAKLPLYNRQITCCSVVPDGSLFATCFHDGTIRIYRMPGAHLIREYKGHKKTITSCAITPDSTRLATVSWDGTTRLWQIPNGDILRTWDVHNGRIAALAGPAGNLVATVTGDGIARIYDGSDGTLIRMIDLYTPLIRAAAMSADGTFLASAGMNATLRIWNVRDGSLVATSEHFTTSQRCCSFLPDNSGLIAGGWDGVCRLFRVPDAHLLRTFSGHTSIVTCCAISWDGSFFITGSNDTTIRLWRTAETEACAVIRESGGEVGAVALSPDETYLATGSSDGIIRLYTLPSGTPAGEMTGSSGRVTALAFTPDNCMLAAGYDSGICTVMSLPEKTILHTIPAHSGEISGIAILSDGRTLITAGDDGLCRFHPLPYVPFLVHTDLTAFADVVREEESTRGNPDNAQWAFLRTLLAARFQGEIEICMTPDVAGYYDIQIVG